jgi:capsule biosynthesis phosphatase
MNDYSFPKPLNMIHGKPAIFYTLSGIPPCVDTLHFVVAPHLKRFHFDTVVMNLFKTKKCVFHDLPYFTRGAAESAWLGTRALDDESKPIVFLDNDVMYDFPTGLFETPPATAFLGYTEDATGSEAFSFMKVDSRGMVVDYKEKVRISNHYCCGVYGFQSLRQFRTLVLDVLTRALHSEVYLSTLFSTLLSRGETVQGIHFRESVHIGSLFEIQRDIAKIPKPTMRICFDLDNTLVTYPTVPGDYSTVRPIERMIQLARRLKSEGHTIIIHTARRMATHAGNVGATIRDIGHQTFKTLEDFAIPCDELLFGKPIADMYIDDRAINPYRTDICSMGLVDFVEHEKPLNMLAPNKHNSLCLAGDSVRKRGPTQFMAGEVFYYTHMPLESKIATHFPKFLGSKRTEHWTEIELEHIKGIPVYTLYKYGLFTQKHLDDLFEMLDCLHNTIVDEPLIGTEKVHKNYVEKLKTRFAVETDYPYTEAPALQAQCIAELETLLHTPYKRSAMIHGDLWFSNLLLDFKQCLRMFDMKGQVDGTYTLGGDVYYDYGKLYQSFLGYDCALYDESVDPAYADWARTAFLRKMAEREVDHERLRITTFSLVMGVFHSIESLEAKKRIWLWILLLRDKGML